ncbi:hypothetical protein IWW51_000064 [Coemansia sp. RSA 2702]|nr:hypothetical protein IWW51_000064 [Coemansia sp. RSA 2702]
MPVPTQSSSNGSTALSRLVVQQRHIDTAQAGKKLRAYILHEYRDMFVRPDAIALLRQKRVQVNGQFVLDTHILQPGDCVRVEIDMIQAIRGRLRGLDVELKYAEPGLVVLLKAPGINKPMIEWAAAALEVTRDDYDGSLPDSSDLLPWIAVNEVDKGLRSIVILVDSEARRQAMLENIDNGLVKFTVCALCHGNIDQALLDQATAKSVADTAKKALCASANDNTRGNTLYQYDMWFQYNNLRADVFDLATLRVMSVTKSSTAGHLTMIQGAMTHTASPSLVLRRLMFELGHPIAGTQTYAKPLQNHKDKGALQAFLKIELPSLADIGKQVVVDEDIPPKLLNVCLREAKFYGQRQKKALAEIARLGGSSGQPAFETFTLDPHVVGCGPFDFIACNPPYVSPNKITQLRTAIEHEPVLALVAESGGYQCYHDIYTSLTTNPRILTSGGCIAFEIGKDMASGVRRIFAGWTEVAAVKDACGFLRVLVFQAPQV